MPRKFKIAAEIDENVSLRLREARVMTSAITEHHPLQTTIRQAAEKLMAFRVHQLPALTEPDDFRELCRDLRAFADIIDPVIEAFGEATDLHSTRNVDLKVFENVLSDALDGNATFEIERSADVLQEDNESMAELSCVS